MGKPPFVFPPRIQHGKNTGIATRSTSSDKISAQFRK